MNLSQVWQTGFAGSSFNQWLLFELFLVFSFAVVVSFHAYIQRNTPIP